MKNLDKAIDNFKYWVETNEENGVCTMPKFICNDLLEAYKKHKELLKEKQPGRIYCGEWILTINELPTPDNSYFGKRYIVCNTIGQVFPLRYIRRTDVHRKTVDRWHYEDGRIYGGAGIVAWMEMPKPLKIFEEKGR